RAARAGLAVGGTTALVGLALVRPISTAGEWWHPAYALAAVVGLASIVLHDGPWPAVLSWRPLAQVGVLGYGVYLIHEPVMRVMTAAGLFPEPRPGPVFLWTALLVIVPTLFLARLSSRTIEQAGARLVAGIDHRGKGRDYYDHLSERDHARGKVGAHR
ncbi:MAG: acyltransferase, partial [Nocardioidaceae bacterium]|nr:acyltransferase [Nocardioidaceae bacterium]